jgi:ribonuclease BN (tRNA processing enzyme)
VVRLTVLGSGDAFGSGGRAHSAYLVEAPGATFLIDCGPSILQSLKRIGRDPGTIDFVLLSHLHGDHFGGVPFLFMEYYYERPRTRPFAVHGPEDSERRVRGLFSALYERTARETLPFAVHYQTVTPGTEYTVQGVRVRPFRVPHSEELVCIAYRLEVAGRTILYSGDSAWTDEFLTQSAGVDLFVCECSTYETRLDIHLAYDEIAERAKRFGCRRLLLSHLGSEPLRHLDTITLECAQDGMTIEL